MIIESRIYDITEQTTINDKACEKLWNLESSTHILHWNLTVKHLQLFNLQVKIISKLTELNSITIINLKYKTTISTALIKQSSVVSICN